MSFTLPTDNFYCHHHHSSALRHLKVKPCSGIWSAGTFAWPMWSARRSSEASTRKRARRPFRYNSFERPGRRPPFSAVAVWSRQERCSQLDTASQSKSTTIGAQVFNQLTHLFVCSSYYGVRYGSNSRLKSPYPELSLRTIIQHPNFTLATVQNDIALFILENAIQPGANVRAVELHTEELAEKDNMTLFGFGLVNGVGFKPAFNLQKADMQIVGEKECAEFIEKLDLVKGEGMFCARSPARSACNVSTFFFFFELSDIFVVLSVVVLELNISRHF